MPISSDQAARYPAVFYLHMMDHLGASRILALSRGKSEHEWLTEMREKAGHPEYYIQEFLSPFGKAKNPTAVRANELGLNFISANNDNGQKFSWDPAEEVKMGCMAILLNDGKPWTVHHTWVSLFAPQSEYAR